MVLDQPARRHSARTRGHTDRTILGLDLDHDGPKGANAPAGAFLAVFGIARHRVGNQAVNQPMRRATLLEIGAARGIGGHAGHADFLDAESCHGSRNTRFSGICTGTLSASVAMISAMKAHQRFTISVPDKASMP